MKNIHLLPTDKGQRITKTSKGTLLWCSKSAEDFIEIRKGYLGFHLYITSDEEIKEGEYYLSWQDYFSPPKFVIYVKSSGVNGDGKKIILTTDQDLIKDGIQAIDDEFLEWFVKNPSCEEVEVELIDTFKKTNEVYVDEITGGNYYEIIKKYKIIIPSEESKQIKCYCGHTTYCDCGPLEEPRKETLKEAAEKLYQEGLQNDLGLSFHDGVKFGAKWQQERMYSEEDMRKAFKDGSWVTSWSDMGIEMKYDTFEKWFEKFKNK